MKKSLWLVSSLIAAAALSGLRQEGRSGARVVTRRRRRPCSGARTARLPPAPAPAAAAAARWRAAADVARRRSTRANTAAGSCAQGRRRGRRDASRRSNSRHRRACRQAALGRLSSLACRRLQASARACLRPRWPSACRRRCTQRLRHQPAHDLGPVVLLAQVRGHHMPQAAWLQRAGDCGGRVVRQVAPFAAHALLEKGRIAGAGQQFACRGCTPAAARRSPASCASTCGVAWPRSVSTPRRRAPSLQRQLQRFARIVRHGEGRDLSSPTSMRFAVAREDAAGLRSRARRWRARCLRSSTPAMPLAQRENARAQPMWSPCSCVTKTAAMSVGAAGRRGPGAPRGA